MAEPTVTASLDEATGEVHAAVDYGGGRVVSFSLPRRLACRLGMSLVSESKREDFDQLASKDDD